MTRRPVAGLVVRGIWVVALCAIGAVGIGLVTPSPALAQMPDARTMSGIARPVDDLPVGTVSVRLIRGDLANVIAGSPVELLVSGKTLVVKSDESGRAGFAKLTPGKTVRAVATVGSERIESEQFAVPDKGGVRLLLVAAGSASGAAPDAPAAGSQPVAGTVVLGGESRVVMQFADDQLEVFYILDILNTGQTPVRAEPLVFEMPADAQGSAVLEGSSPQAVAEGRRVTVSGPFAPGRTAVQLAYSLPLSGDRVSITQRLPAALAQLTVVVQKVGGLTVGSSQIRDVRDTLSEGRTFVMGTGPGLRAGETLTVDLGGLPHRATWPSTVAIGLALVVIGIGVWGAVATGTQDSRASERRQLEARREAMMADLLKLEAQQRSGRMEPARYTQRREAAMTELERIYGALDTGAGARRPEGAGPGV